MEAIVTRKYIPPSNDRLSVGFRDLVPEKYKGTDQFLDLVAWNIRYFHDLDSKRVARVVEVLTALNADVLVFEEIKVDSLDVVAEALRKKGAGHYVVRYGSTGGDQRVAIMYDLDWVRAKDDITELFGRKQVAASDGKDAFPRLPLWGSFVCLSQIGQPFDFQLVGLHLKSQRGGGEAQRAAAAAHLARWLVESAPAIDADVIMTGDWNAAPDAAVWKPFRDLEARGKARFASLNKTHEISHLMFRSKSEFGSRLDLGAVSMAAAREIQADPTVVRWKSLDKLLASNPKAAEIKEYIQQISRNVSDHMPLVTRFYMSERS